MVRDREADIDDQQDEEEEVQPEDSMGWADALEEQFGSVPWWVISTVVHVVILLLLTLITVSVPPLDTSTDIIPMDLARQPEIEEETLEREQFKSDRAVDLPEQVEHPVIIHEEVEELDHMETENNMDNNTARGQEDAISDIPLGGTGVVGNIGVGGGGAGAFGFRTGGGRRRAAMQGGGNPLSEDAVDAALRWLARHQESAGNWEGERKYEDTDPGEDSDAGVTGLAALAFLGAGHTEKTGKFKDNVVRAIGWLRRKQAADGCIGRGYAGGLGYHHAIAGLALAEAYGMARVPMTGTAAQKAVDYSINIHQTEYSGWRYEPKSPGDISVSGWFVMQLKSATIAGLRVDAKGFQGASAFVDKCTKDGGQYPGLVSYQPERSATYTMTSVGMLCRQFMGWKREDPLLVGGANYLQGSLPEWGHGNVNFYYWYYGTLVMFQMGGNWWKSWNASLRDMLIERQRKGPPKIDGSWDPLCVWNAKGGRVYSTALGALCLEVYYRYLPLYK
jgi:hypothetical protein